MTTRFKPDDLTEGLTGAIHETGHALYEQGRNLQLDGLPINEVNCNASSTSLFHCLTPSLEHFSRCCLGQKISNRTT